jgi:hypothetical protein
VLPADEGFNIFDMVTVYEKPYVIVYDLVNKLVIVIVLPAAMHVGVGKA